MVFAKVVGLLIGIVLFARFVNEADSQKRVDPEE